MNQMAPEKNVDCPICGKPSVARYKPFCSKRCADVDLNRWFSGAYVVHTDEKPDEGNAALVQEDENF